MTKTTSLEKMQVLSQYIGHIDKTNQEIITQLILDNFDRVLMAPGALESHQAWPGGFLDHILDMITIGETIYKTQEDLPFTFGDLVLVILLHDIEKPFRYVEPAMPFEGATNQEIYDFLGKTYHFVLDEMHLNALKYAHGENEHYIPHKRVMKELGGYLHACDVISARSHYNKVFKIRK